MNMTLRMAIDLYNDLKKIALEEERSINGEICYILKKYIEEYKKVRSIWERGEILNIERGKNIVIHYQVDGREESLTLPF